jgi:hypothetical protein
MAVWPHPKVLEAGSNVLWLAPTLKLVTNKAVVSDHRTAWYYNLSREQGYGYRVSFDFYMHAKQCAN